jgi:MFS transporter, DHA2 family, multidrug resistance protein
MESNALASSLTSGAGRREWIGLAVLALPTLLVSMDATVTYLALPALSQALNPTGSELLWITDIFTFMEGGFLIIMGALGDRVGRKRLLMIGFVLFSIASVMAAFAFNPWLLILSRALLGITGAIILPCTLSLIRSMFHDERQRTVAFGIYTACYAGGTMLGPLLGGILLTYFWWGSVFLISVPLMLVFLLTAWMLPEYRDPQAKQFNLLSALLLMTSMLTAIFGIKRIAESGVVDLVSVVTIFSGIVLGFLFLYSQKKIHNPLINLDLFKIRIFSITLATLFIAMFCWSGLYLFISQYLQLVLGFEPLKAGLLTLLPAAVTMVGCMSAPYLQRWFRKTVIIVLGNLAMLAGMILVTQLTIAPALPLLILTCTCLSLGCGFVVTLGIDMVVSSAPQEQAGAASGISESSTTFGSAIGVALLGSIGNAMYHRNMITNNSSSSIPDEAISTLGGAFSTAERLAPETGSMLMENARSAFMVSLNAAAIVAAVLLIIMVLAFSFVQNKRSSAGT